MKIINSNYIPLPEPHRLIAAPNSIFYEQIGTLSVLQESKTERFGYKTIDHPVVRIAGLDGKDSISGGESYVISHGEGYVLYDITVGECAMLCHVDNRKLPFARFNMLITSFFIRYEWDSSDVDTIIDQIDVCKIKLEAPKKLDQNVELTFSMSHDGMTPMISSNLSNFQFYVRLGEIKDDMITLDLEKIFMEFVNLARVYIRINPNYQFHFSSPLKKLSELVKKLNNELNDYLVRNDE